MFLDKSFGQLVLVLGTITMVWGGIMALASDDLMKTLAGSSMSQIGFITVGLSMCGLLGEDNAVAVNGTFLHMVNHTLFKLALFFMAGVVVSKVGTGKLQDIRGFGKGKPLLHVCFALSGLGIAGVPLLNGYVSKTLIHEALVEYGNAAFEWLFLASGGLTLAYMLKLYVVLFWEEPSEKVAALNCNGTLETEVNRSEAVEEEMLSEEYESEEIAEPLDDLEKQSEANKMSATTWVAFVIPVICYPVMGLFPNQVMDKLAQLGSGFFHGGELNETVHYFSLENLKGSAISVGLGLIFYVLFVRCMLRRKTEQGVTYKNGLPAWMDLEKVVYRPLFLKVLPCIGTFVSRILDWIVDGIVLVMRRTIYRDNNREEKPVYGGRFLDVVGEFFNWLRDIWNGTVGKKHPIQKNFVITFAKNKKKASTRVALVSKSVSFGLFMFALGFCLTIAYLIYLM
jgi:hydrogenase-4 component B